MAIAAECGKSLWSVQRMKNSHKVRQPVAWLILLAVMVVFQPVPIQAQTRRTVTPARNTGIATEAAYTLGAGDRILLDIFNVPEYSREYQVLVNGTVNLPLIGSVSVQGLTLDQAANLISQRYTPYLRRPIVTISLVAPRPLKIAISGEVNRPGSYTIPFTAAGGGVQQPSLTQALTIAGGITQAAALRGAQVRRVQRGGTQVINVDLWALLRGGDLSQDITLRDGDSIFIPTTSGVNLAESPIKAEASFAPAQNQPLNVVVVGEVTRPGPQVVQPDQSGARPTVSRAIQVAGGIRPAADITRVQVRRPTRQGNIQTVTVDLNRLLLNGDRDQDLILQQGDTIVVPTASQINTLQALDIAAATFAPSQAQPVNVVVAGEVTRPGPYNVQPVAPGAIPTVSRAIQAAGGATQSADLSRIEIRRITRGGGEQSVVIDLNQLVRAGDRRQDLNLQEGDTIFIPTSREVNVAQSLEIASSSIAADPSQPLNIAVVGEIQRPGTYTLQTTRPAAGSPGSLPSFAGLPTVSQAIQLAGGITQAADIRRIEVRRITRIGTQQILAVNFWQLLQAGDRTQDVVLQQGDTIFVPTAIDVNPAEASQIATASISPSTIRINVVGEVARPGVIQVPPNTPLNQAILTAGGFNNRARRSFVDLIRLNPNGTVSRRGVEVDFARGINEEGNPILRENDVIVVRRSSLAQISDTLGTVLTPVGSAFSLFNFFNILGGF